MRGMIISYESANYRFEQSKLWNETHGFKEINIENENYTVFSFSDIHVGSTKNLDTVLNRATSQQSAAVVMVGDLTTGRPNDYEVFNQQLLNFDTLQIFPIVGNHDLYFNGWEQFYSRFGATSYYFTINTPTASDLYICIDTGSGTLGSKQLNWLKKLLETERLNFRYCTIFTHNNLFRFRHTPTTNPTIEELHVLLDLFVKHDVNMVITGHDHIKDYENFGNTTHITMSALLDGYSDAGYLEINIEDDSLKFQFVDI